jgi:hypothetical protein
VRDLNPRPKDYETAHIGLVGCCNLMPLRLSGLVSVENYCGKLSQVSQICPKESDWFLAVLWLSDNVNLYARFPLRTRQTFGAPRAVYLASNLHLSHIGGMRVTLTRPTSLGSCFPTFSWLCW